jgi:hypothetical protein
LSAYRVEFHAKVDTETLGLPEAAFTALFDMLVAVSRDPWRLSRMDARMGDASFRWAAFDHGLGAVHFKIDDEARVIRVHGITWTG